ncbi:trans-sialidase, putative [Trypanosoma cruzi marinkellei]|uniref:Trans-sialidase, putative n=1 Tax=Trypanosoma cruzi marinkellei TaxID=85056 RepID=K2MYV4_TRYCR|nr:trans-sialidase, putative [Trypanosoma cruzi marinkellei]
MAAFFEGQILKNLGAQLIRRMCSDFVAGYLDSAWNFPVLFGEANKGTWRAHTVLVAAEGKRSLGGLLRPTTTTNGNGVFLLVGSSDVSNAGGYLRWGSLDLKLVVAEVTDSMDSGQSEGIRWKEPTSPPKPFLENGHKDELKDFCGSGVSGVRMGDGKLVFPLMAKNINHDFLSMIIYLKDNSSNWALSVGAHSADCGEPRITEWEGSLLVATRCHGGDGLCTNCVRWGERGRGSSGHFRACGRRHMKTLSSQIGLLGPSSPEH